MKTERSGVSKTVCHVPLPGGAVCRFIFYYTGKMRKRKRLLFEFSLFLQKLSRPQPIFGGYRVLTVSLPQFFSRGIYTRLQV